MPSYVIVDTDVFSYIWQGRPEATQFEPALRNKIPVLSHTSVAEVYFGASYAGWGEKKLRQLDAAIRPLRRGALQCRHGQAVGPFEDASSKVRPFPGTE